MISFLLWQKSVEYLKHLYLNEKVDEFGKGIFHDKKHAKYVKHLYLNETVGKS